MDIYLHLFGDLGLAAEVRQVLDVNKQERHIRGGLATRNKYLQKERQIEKRKKFS